MAAYRTADAVVSGTEDVSTFEVGGKVGFGGFIVAAGYGDNGDSFCTTAAVMQVTTGVPVSVILPGQSLSVSDISARKLIQLPG